LARRAGRVTLFDPLYNYVSLWNPPVRDPQLIVMITLPAHVPVGVIHLAGGWRSYGRRCLEAGLLYRSGDYLTLADSAVLSELESRSWPDNTGARHVHLTARPHLQIGIAHDAAPCPADLTIYVV
jgi:hypothetical protein